MTLSQRLNRPNSEDANRFPHAPSLQASRDEDGSDSIAELKDEVYDRLLTRLGQKLYGQHIAEGDLEVHVFDAVSAAIAANSRPFSTIDRVHLAQEITDDILGHGPLEPLLRDDEVTEIMVVGHERVWVERRGKIFESEARFEDEEHLRRTIERVVSRVGRRIDESSPMVDARLPDGSRVNAVLPPIALDGACLTIRKFAAEPFTADDLLAMRTFSRTALDVAEACVRGRLNILISGGTGSGKTTTLNVLSGFVPSDERIVTIEDSAELQLTQPHVLRLESRPPNIEGEGLITIRDLVRNALRMRPDRIIVGEVRDSAALDMLQAMNTGHDGSITTVHANSPQDALSRVETMVLMAGMGLPVTVIREYIARAIDVIFQQSRLRDGSRQITQITEVLDVHGDAVQLRDLFRFEYYDQPTDGRLGELRPTGETPGFIERLRDRGVILDQGIFR
jgi:pilus assembly protein CpaF